MSFRDAVVAGIRVVRGKPQSAARAAVAVTLMIAATTAAEARSLDVISAGTAPGVHAGVASTRAALPEGSIVVAGRAGKFARGLATGTAVGIGRAAARERNRNALEADNDAADPAPDEGTETPAETTATPAPAPETTVTRPAVEPTAASMPALPIGQHDCFAGCNAPQRVAAPAKAQPAQAAGAVAGQATGHSNATFECVAGCATSAPQRAVAGANDPDQAARTGTASNRVTVLRGTSRSKVYGVSD